MASRLFRIRTSGHWASAVAVTLVAASCGNDILPTQSQPISAAVAPATRLNFSVQPSTATAGAPIRPAVQVIVRNRYGSVVTTSTASITVALGGTGNAGAHLRGTLTVNAVAGVATFPTLSVDSLGTGYALTASASGLASASSTTFRVVAAPAAKLGFTVQPSVATAGAAITPAVKVAVRDSVGNLVTASAAKITMALSAGTGTTGAHLKGTLSVSAVKGVATFSTLNVDSAGTGYTLTASAGNLTAATSGAFDVAAAPANQLSFNVQPATTTAGTQITPAVSVSVLDRFGNVVKASTATITVALASGAGTAGAHLRGVLAVNAENGVATFPTLSVDSVGAGYKLTASASGVTGSTSVGFAVVAAPAAMLSFAVQPSSIAPGEAISPAVMVAVRDSVGNLVTASTASVALALGGAGPGGAQLGGTTTVSAVAGIATFSTLTVDSLGTGYTLTASASDLAGATSTAFDVAVAPPVKLSFSVQPSTATAGSPIAPAVTVAVQDRLGNLAASSTASVTVALSNGVGTAGAHLRGTLTATAENGVATFPALSVDSVGIGYTLTASAAGLTGSTSGAFAVVAAPAAMLTFTVQPSKTTVGEAISPAVKVAVRDSVGNLVTASADYVTVALSGAGPAGAQLGGTTTVSAAVGVATFSTLTVDSAGAGYTLTATAADLASATSNAFAVDSTSSTYTTSFPLTENPISEGGRWINGGTVGLDWTDISTTPGLAVGHEVNGNASDATAILTGTWAADQYAQATVFWSPDPREPVPEVELRLRSAITAHVSRGYEITFGGGYLIIVRWNGPFQNYTYLLDAGGSQYTPKTGDVIKATIVGTTISAYKNGVLMGQVTDGTWTDGAPGMGFNSGTHGGTYNSTYGYTSFTAGPM